MQPLEDRIAALETRIAALEETRLVQVYAWAQRKTPEPGTKIGHHKAGNVWEPYREDRAEHYDLTAVYIGFGLAATCQ